MIVLWIYLAVTSVITIVMLLGFFVEDGFEIRSLTEAFTVETIFCWVLMTVFAFPLAIMVVLTIAIYSLGNKKVANKELEKCNLCPYKLNFIEPKKRETNCFMDSCEDLNSRRN